MRRLNLVFLAVLMIGATVLGGGVHLVHGFQMRRNASALLDRARRAESAANLAKAEESLRWYLNLRPDDGPAWVSFAHVVDERNADRRRPEQNFLVHEEALRHNPGDKALKRRSADLALELRRYNDAQRHLNDLLNSGQSTGSELAELEDLLGQCESATTLYQEAERSFVRALEHDPGRVACYDRLARLRRTELRQIETADNTIKEMVAKNPKSGLAYINRWRYVHDFAPPADDKDIREGVERAPDDLEVLFTAAVASEQKPDAASARLYWEKGRKLDPKNVAFALGLSHLETRENHLDRAESILRAAFKATPTLDLAFELAENLILQNKIDGDDQAGAYLARLRSAGFGDSYVAYLETRILLNKNKWSEAIPAIQSARIALKSDPRLTAQLDLMLAECYGRVGSEEQRLDALRQVAGDERGPEAARIAYAGALARADKLDQAIAILLPMVERKPELRLDVVGLLIQRTSRQLADQRNWQAVEQQLREAENALPKAVESLTLLRVNLLTAQDRLEDAVSLLTSAQKKEPLNLQYRLVQARLAQRQGHSAAALSILDQAEKDVRPGLDIQLARMDYWGQEGGDAAKAAVAKLARTYSQVPAADRPAFLDRLAAVENRLGEPALARKHWRELAGLQPGNVQVFMGLFDLAMQASDDADARDLVSVIRKLEGETGTLWRFAQASYLLEQARRGAIKDLEAPRILVAEITARRPDWWGESLLLAELAELTGQTDEAIKHYTRAIERDAPQPGIARRLVGLLNERKQFDQIDHVVKLLRDRGMAPGELTISTALNALRLQDFDRAISLARQIFPESSGRFGDHLFLGQFYLAAGRRDEAGQQLRRTVELGPGTPITWVTYVQYLVQGKQIDQAKAVVESARKALPADRSNLALAQCAGMLGEAEEADERIQAALNSPNCDLTAIRVAVDLYINQARFDRVEPILKKILDPALHATQEDLAWANRARALARVSTGRSAEKDLGLALVEQNLKKNPSSLADQKLMATFLALRNSRRDDAIKILEPLDKSNQLDRGSQFLLAQLYERAKQDDKYRNEMSKLLDLNVKDPQHLVHFIAFLFDRNLLTEVDRWTTELKKLEPGSSRLFDVEARLLKARNRDRELLALLLDRGRQRPDELGSVARLLDRYGFPLEAEEAFKAFNVRDPGKPERGLLLAQFLARHDRTREAAEILRNSWKTCRPEAVAFSALPLYDAPSSNESLRREVEAWVSAAIQKNSAAAALRSKLAIIYFKQGRYDEAEALLRQVLATDPEDVEALNSLAWELALRDAGKSKEALDLINRAIEKAGNVTALVDTRAVALIQSGEPGQAEQELRNAQASDPKNVSLALHLAWAYQVSGMIQEARMALRHAEELGLKPESRHQLERGIIDRLRSQLTTNDPSRSNHG